MTRPCDLCGNRWPCVELDRFVFGSVYACHECRDQKSCPKCLDAYLKDLNDRDYDAQWQPAGMGGAMSDFYLRDDAYTEPYDPPQYCRDCRILLDGWTRPEDHEPLCPRHPDFREDLAELEDVELRDTEDGELLAVLKGAA